MRARPFVWLAILALPAVVRCGASAPPPSPTTPTPQRAEMVGREVCSTCHDREAELWAGSHHALAMQSANAKSVLGAFDGRHVDHAGVTSTFRRDADGFAVRTDGPDGALHDYKLSYTFGVDPLQQYLIEISPGRYQALSLFWDARPPAKGGQAWRHLHPDQAVDHLDPLHWTGAYQNWNYMCAECHSTGLRRAYSVEEDRFHTTWKEIDVSCEACHGPGSRHVAWAQEGEKASADRGLAVSMSDHDGGEWKFAEGTGIARRIPPRASHAQVETCALCHSRRNPLADGYVHGRPLADSHDVVLLEEGLYFPDGQILEEDYEYGSFLQSAMHRAGVTCTDCHDPHAAGKKPLDDGACARCHLPSQFDVPAHHHHRAGSAGASCIGCHMPTRTYMVVDVRHDHSFRIPRPDLSVKIGSPNTCTGCHHDRDAAWAAATVARWYPSGRSGSFHYGEALRAGRVWAENRGPLLRRVISDVQTPAIVRATALSLLARQLGPEDVKVVDRSLADGDPIVRRAAVAALEAYPPPERWQRGRALLSDPIRSVRLQAAWMLSDRRPGAGDAPADPVVDAAFEEYLASQRCNADRAAAWLNMGQFHLRRGDAAQAEKDYRSALDREPSYVPAYVNLADLYRAQGRDAEGEGLLREALRRDPRSADAHYALGLQLSRLGRAEEGIEELKRAASTQDDPRFSYALGIAQSSAGRYEQALLTLGEAYRRFPGFRRIVLALATINREHGSPTEAIAFARRLVALDPADPEAGRLLASLEAKRR